MLATWMMSDSDLNPKTRIILSNWIQIEKCVIHIREVLSIAYRHVATALHILWITSYRGLEEA